MDSLDFGNRTHKSRNHDQIVWTIFVNISKYIRNQRLIFNCVAIFDLLNMMDSSDLNCGTHKIGFHSKKSNAQITVKNTVHPQIHSRADLQSGMGGGLTDLLSLPMILCVF